MSFFSPFIDPPFPFEVKKGICILCFFNEGLAPRTIRRVTCKDKFFEG